MKNRENLTKTNRQATPPGLSKSMRQWWDYLTETYVFTESEYHLLRLACYAFDRTETARRVLQRDGLTFQDRYGSYHARPEATIERQSRADFARLVKQLYLGHEEPTPPGRRPGYSPK